MDSHVTLWQHRRLSGDTISKWCINGFKTVILQKIRDIVSGFEGICDGVIEWIYGCSQYVVQPKSPEPSKRVLANQFFEKQLEVIDEGISSRVEAPAYEEPGYFGKICKDKVTGVEGVCVGRVRKRIISMSEKQYRCQGNGIKSEVKNTEKGIKSEGERRKNCEIKQRFDSSNLRIVPYHPADGAFP